MKLSVVKLVLVVAVGISLLSGFLYLYYQSAVNRKNNDGSGAAEFLISPGQKVYEVAENLRKAKLINSAAAFKIYVRFHNLDNKLQAGYYRISRNLSLKEVVDVLQHGKRDLRLTFPEGWRREEMAFAAAKILARPAFYAEFLKETEGLEGFLFPETYLVPREISARDLVRVMKEIFNKKYTQAATAPGANKELPQREVIILASIVEREAKKDEDRSVIAGILIKRFQNGWPLEADATVQYALASARLTKISFEGLLNFEFWPKNISFDDLKIDSAYNSRRRSGLPPGPIGNPGLASINGVLNAVETPYWYYLTDADGNTHFAKTLEEHNRNVNRYLHP